MLYLLTVVGILVAAFVAYVTYRQYSLSRGQSALERRVAVEPRRRDSVTGRVVYEIVGQHHIDEVVFEFRNYAGAGGSCNRSKVPPGITELGVSDFTEESELATPVAKHFHARVRWLDLNGQWQHSGLHVCSKMNTAFVPTED